jgi:chromosome segregation ATPase
MLSERGFRGTLIMDHTQKLMDVRVEPDITRRDGSGRSARTLSGGEKSFAQICLLLAIWEAMGAPIRCLDEFDVFMDAVNRTISVNLLIEGARQSIGRQFILISPGTKTDIKKAPDVNAIE